MQMIPSSIMLPQILTTKDHIFNYLRMNKCIILDRPIQKELDLIIQHLQVLNDEVKFLLDWSPSVKSDIFIHLR